MLYSDTYRQYIQIPTNTLCFHLCATEYKPYANVFSFIVSTGILRKYIEDE